MRAAPRFGRFDLQVRLVLVLLVAFLGMLDLLNIVLLGRARDALESSSEAHAALAADSLATWIGRDALGDGLAERGALDRLPSVVALRREAFRRNLLRAQLLDARGRVVVGSDLGGGGRPEPVVPFSADDRAALEAGRTITARVDARGGLDPPALSAAAPVLGNDGRLIGAVRVLEPASDLVAFERRGRALLWVQVVGVLAIAGIVLLFANWVSRPYRRLAAAADEAGIGADAGGATTEPDDLARAFRAMIAKLRAQDEALGNAEREATGLGDLVRFASRSAAGLATGVLVLDRRATVAALNPAAARLLEADPETSRGRPLVELAPPVEGLADLVRACLERGQAASREVLAVRYPDGRDGHLGVTISPSASPKGDVAGALLLMTDLTEIRRIQDQARLRESLATVGTISAGIAHEFRNALGTILGYARMLEKRDDPRVHGPAREILKEVEGSRRMVDEFLLYAKPPKPERERFELEPLLRGCAEVAPRGLEVAIDGEFGRVEGDAALLRRAFDNLLQNAADAGRGRPTPVQVGIHGRSAASGRVVQIEVEDDGPGIPHDRLERVFVPFESGRPGGTGLGLALVERTVVDMGGTVEASAGPRGGAMFRIRLPLAIEEPSATP